MSGELVILGSSPKEDGAILNKTPRKLKLHRETLAALHAPLRLRAIHGATDDTGYSRDPGAGECSFDGCDAWQGWELPPDARERALGGGGAYR